MSSGDTKETAFLLAPSVHFGALVWPLVHAFNGHSGW